MQAIIAIAAIFSIVAAVGALALFVDMLGWSRLGTLTCLCTQMLVLAASLFFDAFCFVVFASLCLLLCASIV